MWKKECRKTATTHCLGLLRELKSLVGRVGEEIGELMIRDSL